MSDPAAAPLLACRDLDLRYGARMLVRGLQWNVRRGELWAVVGPNGAGQSSLLRVLAGAQRPAAGTVALAGLPADRTTADALAAIRAFVADRWADPFGFTARDTVLAGRFRLRGGDPDAAAAALRFLEQVACAHLADRDVRGLSRGERQRVAIAAALAQETPLLFLDEPVSHQDPRQRGSVLRCLTAAAQGDAARTIIAVFHDLDAALRFATHALLLSGDGAWHAGTAQDVLTSENLAQLFGVRFIEACAEGRRIVVAE